jgi:hypothetical protein
MSYIINDDGVERPATPEETAVLDLDKLRAEQAKQQNGYKISRAAEYLPMADYIDGIVKGDTAQVQTYIDACLAVKAKYPKPI